jgi:Mor family transcriptional regulator
MRLSELNISKSQLVSLADDYIFNARNKSLFLHKVEGYTYEELSEMYNLSTVRTKEIVKECLNKVSRHIES